MRFTFSVLAAALWAKLVFSQNSSTTTSSTTTTSGTDLGGGIVTRTDVRYLADLTLDVRDIDQYLNSGGGTQVAMEIYVNGKNAAQQNLLKFSLASIGTKLVGNGLSKASPNFLFQLYGLAGLSTDLNELLKNSQYADSYIRTAISDSSTLAGDSILALSLWMYTTHVMYQGLDTCQKLTLADNPSQFKLAGGGMDEFIALWIGTGQEPASSDGYSLYALTERAADLFGTSSQNGESPVNSNLKSLYQEGAVILSDPAACSKQSDGTPQQLWSVVHRAISQMNVPLIQMLIKSLLDGDTSATELYALAIAPQIAQCRPSIFKRLNEELLSGNPNFSKSQSILADLQDIYACLGITCDMVGTYSGSSTVTGASRPLLCDAAVTDLSLAQYYPSSDVQPVSSSSAAPFSYFLISHSHWSMQIARIDLDILQMKILTSLSSFNYASFWYSYGRNSPIPRTSENDPYTYYSIGGYAVSTSLKNADPIYTAFVKYYNDPNYADTIIRNTLEGTGKWGNSSVAQRSAIITVTSAFDVIFMLTIAEINDAVNACNGVSDGGTYTMTHPWDEVAALIIGSLEGSSEGGSPDLEDGQLIWGLANQRAFQFQTENSKGYSKVDQYLEDLLFAGKGEIDATDCTNLEATANNIKNEILVPLMQSVLRYAISEQSLDASSSSADLAYGESFALAIIPIIKTFDSAAADIIAQNMIVASGAKLVRDGAQVVADALGAAAKANGLGCSSIGYTSQVDPCKNNGGRSSASTLQPLLLSAGSVLCLWLVV